MSRQLFKAVLQNGEVNVLSDFKHDCLVVVMRLREILLEEPALDGSQRYVPGHRTLFGSDCRRGICQLGQRGYCRMPEQLSWRDDQSGLTGPGDNLQADNRIPTQLEEVIVNADPLQPERA